jgi:TetR/AcrR family transcriptional repressor of nem operon
MNGTAPSRPNTKTRLLDAALTEFRTKGYCATSVDDLCRAAGVTKGSFFHHFRSKEELGIAAAAHFSAEAEDLFADATYRNLADPRERLLAYVDFRRALLQGDLPEYTCLLGTLVQETYVSHPALTRAGAAGITAHAATLEADIAATLDRYGSARARGITARSVALHIQAVIQGAFILAKATGGPDLAAECLGHLRRYLELLFDDQDPQPDQKVTSE